MIIKPLPLNGRGPISSALRVLDRRTREIATGDASGLRVSRTPSGTVIEPINRPVVTRATPPASDNVPRWG